MSSFGERYGERYQANFVAGAIVRNGPGLTLAKVLGDLYRTSNARLLVRIVCVFIVAGFAYSTALRSLNCIDDEFERVAVFFVCVSHLGGGDPPDLDPHWSCRGLEACGTFIGLLLQVVCFAVLTVKLLMPESTVVFSKKMLLTTRNKKPLLMFRFAHPQGHALYNITVTCVTVLTRTTTEGETHGELVPIHFKCGPSGVAPQMCTHAFDPDSPLAEHAASRLQTAQGMTIAVQLTAYDSTARVNINATYSYQLCDNVQRDGSFASILLVNPTAAAREGKRIEFDLAPLHDIVLPKRPGGSSVDTAEAEPSAQRPAGAWQKSELL
jgi:hypothetical protein